VNPLRASRGTGLYLYIGEASSWDSLGYAEHQLSNLDEAVGCYGRALSIFGELGNRYYQADTLTHLGDTHHAAGQENKAQAAWRQAATGGIWAVRPTPGGLDWAARPLPSSSGRAHAGFTVPPPS